MQVIDNHQFNTVYKFDLTTSQEVYHSILRGITRSDFCASHGHPVLPELAKRFSIPDLVKMHDCVMHHATDENIRNWAYICKVVYIIELCNSQCVCTVELCNL